MSSRHEREAKWEAFHKANPQIYAMLVQICKELKAAGHDRFGIRQIWERLRWMREVEAWDENSFYKLNDHYTPFYARLIMASEPELEDFFEIRGEEAVAA